MLNTLRRRADYATLSRRGTFREWTREVRLREYVKRALKATAAVAVIILAGGAVYSLAEGRQFAESCYTALAIATTIGVSDDLEPKSAAGRCFTVFYSLSTFVALPLLLNVAANGVARVGLTLWGAVAGYELTRDPTLRHQRRLDVRFSVTRAARIDLRRPHGLHVHVPGAVVLGVRLLRIYGTLVDRRRRHGSAHAGGRRLRGVLRAWRAGAVDACVEINQCVGRNAIKQASRRWRGGRRDDSALAVKFPTRPSDFCDKAYLDDEELPESPRLLRRDSSQIEGRSLNWVLGTVYNVLNLPRRLSAQALASATTNPLRP